MLGRYATHRHHSGLPIIIYVRTVLHHVLIIYDKKFHSQTLQQLKGSDAVKEPNMFHNYETEKITLKASDAAENLQLYQVVRFFRPSSLCTMTNLMLFSECQPIYASCMTISGGRTEQLNIIAGFLPRHWLCK